jgi:hypothetical protein
MPHRYTLLITILALTSTVALAADLDQNLVDDKLGGDGVAIPTTDGTIAVVDTGDSGVAYYVNRLTDLGFTVATIPMASGLDVLVNHPLVILPVSHGSLAHYAVFDGLAADYHAYVQTGGGLWVGQPNPYQMPGDEADITWVPFYLRLHNGYLNEDCPPVIVDATHCITTGLPGTQFSMPGDEVLSMGPEWQVLVEGGVTGRPGVLVAEYGAGKILVELGHPAMGSVCPIDDAAMVRYVECTMDQPVAVESSTWSGVKARFR